MKKVTRQDGSEVELDDATAEKWVKIGIGVYSEDEKKPEKIQTKQIKGESK